MKKLKQYLDPEDFWTEVSPSLKLEEAKNGLCLGRSCEFRTAPEDGSYQAAVFEDNELLGAMVGSPFRTKYNLIPSPVSDPETAEMLLNDFLDTANLCTGLVAETTTSNIYRGLLEGRGKETVTHVNQGTYRCRQVQMPEDQGLIFRLANENDVRLVGQWMEAFCKEVVPHDPPINGVESATEKIEKEMIYLLVNDSTPVSVAAKSRDIKTSCSINFVYTPMALRKRGYASLTTAKLTQHLLDEGKTETNLYTDMANPTSNKIYQNIGYEFVCESVHFGIS